MLTAFVTAPPGPPFPSLGALLVAVGMPCVLAVFIIAFVAGAAVLLQSAASRPRTRATNAAFASGRVASRSAA